MEMSEYKRDIRKMAKACEKCGNTLFEIWADTVECTNCGWEREYKTRNGHSGKPTKSQLAILENIKSAYPMAETIEDTFCQDTGFLYVSIYTGPNIYLEEGGFVKIGRKGSVEVMHSYAISEDKELWMSILESSVRTGESRQEWRLENDKM